MYQSLEILAAWSVFSDYISLKYFSCLSGEEKREEMMRLLPAITSFERNFNEVRDEIEASLNKLERTNLRKR